MQEMVYINHTQRREDFHSMGPANAPNFEMCNSLPCAEDARIMSVLHASGKERGWFWEVINTKIAKMLTRISQQPYGDAS